MEYQRRKKSRKRCRFARPVDAEVVRHNGLLQQINSPEEIEKRRHQKIAIYAYLKWQERLAGGEPGDELRDWLLAESEADAGEEEGKDAWSSEVYGTVLESVVQVTRLPPDEVTLSTPLPASTYERRFIYTLVFRILAGRPVEMEDPEDGFADTVGELLLDVFLHFHWIKYML